MVTLVIICLAFIIGAGVANIIFDIIELIGEIIGQILSLIFDW